MENMNVGTTLTEYGELEQNIIAVIKKCNEKNLKVKLSDSYDASNLFNVKNATSVNHYVLDNGLNVYKILNGDEAIDYMISSEPLYTEKISIDSNNKKHLNKYYSGTSCIEYSMGGIGNAIPIDVTDYVMPKHISFLGPNYRGSGLDKNIVSSGSGLVTSGYFRPYSDKDLLKDCTDGKLITYLTKYVQNPRFASEKTLGCVKAITATIEKVKEKANEVEQKKGFFRNLLAKNKKLDEQMEIFGKQGQVR